MINSKFYAQTSRCPVCNGWGNVEKEGAEKREECTKCGGKGVFLAWTDNIFFFGAPTYVDFKVRNKVKTIKIVIIILSIMFLFLLVYVFGQFIKFLFN